MGREYITVPYPVDPQDFRRDLCECTIYCEYRDCPARGTVHQHERCVMHPVEGADALWPSNPPYERGRQ